MGKETEVTCDDCGKETTVPFEPSEGRPVYCQSCYEKRQRSGGGNNTGHTWDRSDYAGYDPEKHAADNKAS
jgi:CxxC-x17-CxxC domain-containing protein